jgi:23S rRNA (uracil-5-)-methyltransferase RumA
MKEQDQFILDIKRLGINGEGIGFYNKLAVFVDGAIPGEGHEILVTRVEPKMAFGQTVQIKTESPARCEAKCQYYGTCGGCNVMHISYEKMLEEKRNLVIEALNRYTRLNTRSFEIKPTVPSPQIYGYRNKSQLAIKKDGKSYVCMTKKKSNDLLYVESCDVQNPLINKLNNEILAIIDELGITPYLYKFNRGVLKFLVIRVNKKNEAQVCFVCKEKTPKLRELAKRVIKLDGVKSVYENFSDSMKQGVIFGDVTNHLEGDKYIIEELGRIKYQIYPTTFFQLNTLQAENMYSIVQKACKLSRKERVLDAYCGVGSIGLYIANMASEVIGIEYNQASVDAANENAKLNRINNAKFYQGDAAELLPKMIEDGIVFDVVVADPPRVGLGDVFINTLLETEVRRIIYVSCNPSTLAKDLEKLSAKYKINSITPIDMFPQTAHVESVVLLEKKSN